MGAPGIFRPVLIPDAFVSVDLARAAWLRQTGWTGALSACLRGEGTHRVSDGEGEVGREAVPGRGVPHLTPTLSAPQGRRGGSPRQQLLSAGSWVATPSLRKQCGPRLRAEFVR